MSSDLTIGISLGGEERGRTQSPENVSAEPRPAEEWGGRFRRSASQLLDSDIVRSVVGRFGAGAPEERLDPHAPYADTDDGAHDVDMGPEAITAPKFSRVEVMNRSLDIMQSTLARHQLAAYPPDVLVEIPRTACRSLDFHKAADMIALGRSLTELRSMPLGSEPPPGKNRTLRSLPTRTMIRAYSELVETVAIQLPDGTTTSVRLFPGPEHHHENRLDSSRAVW